MFREKKTSDDTSSTIVYYLKSKYFVIFAYTLKTWETFRATRNIRSFASKWDYRAVIIFTIAMHCFNWTRSHLLYSTVLCYAALHSQLPENVSATPFFCNISHCMCAVVVYNLVLHLAIAPWSKANDQR